MIELMNFFKNEEMKLREKNVYRKRRVQKSHQKIYQNDGKQETNGQRGVKED